MDWLKCKICFNTYNQSNLRPHSLSCGHTYCERCLKDAIQNETLTCPQCRKIHEINSVFDIPINLSLQYILKLFRRPSQDDTGNVILNPFEEKSDKNYKREANVNQDLILNIQEKQISQQELLKISAGECNEHPSNECLFRCSDHMCWVCEKCIDEYGDHSNQKCKISSFKEEIEFRRQEHIQSLDDERKSCDDSFSVIESHVSCLKDKKESHIRMVNHLQEVLNMHIKDEESLNNEILYFQKIIKAGKVVHQKLLDAEVAVTNAVNLVESNVARDLIKNKTAESRKWIDDSQKDVFKGKQKIYNQPYLDSYKEKYKVIHEKLESITNNSGMIGQSAETINSRNGDIAKIDGASTPLENLAFTEGEKNIKEETKKEVIPEIVGGIKHFVSHKPKKKQNVKIPNSNDVPTSLKDLINMEGKKKEKEETEKEALSEIVAGIKHFVKHEPKKNIAEVLRVKIILRLLQLTVFEDTIYKPDENDNKSTYASYYTLSNDPIRTEEGMSIERMLRWIKEDLDDIWASQHGDRQDLAKSIHGIISNLVLDISPEQFHHFFGCFQTLCSTLSMKQRENLLELIQTIFKGGKNRFMAEKVLSVLWSLSFSGDLPAKIMDQTVYAHVKILDSTCSMWQKKKLIDCCVEKLKHNNHVLIALKYIREIICTCPEESPENPDVNITITRADVIAKLQKELSIVSLLVDNLTTYMKNILSTVKRNPNFNPKEISCDGRSNHINQIEERLYFLQFFLQDGDLWLCKPQAEQIWNCLMENAVFAIDRDICFKWFSTLIEDDNQDLDPEVNIFFFNKIMLLDPSILTHNGMECFTKFFKIANKRKIELVLNSQIHYIEDKDLIGHDYLWRIILCSSEDIAARASELLRTTFIDLSLQPKLKINNIIIHDYFISKCMFHLESMYNNSSVLEKNMNSSTNKHEESMQMCKVLTVLYKYLFSCNRDFVKSGYNISHKFQDMLKKYSAGNLYHMSNIFLK